MTYFATVAANRVNYELFAREQSLSVLLVEQNVVQTPGVVDRAYVIRSGRVILEQRADELRERDSYWDLF